MPPAPTQPGTGATPWTQHPTLTALGPSLQITADCWALLALMAGWWGLREVLRRPVVETLRRSAAI